MAWLYLFIAGIFETGWAFSLKFMRFGDLKTLRFTNFYKVAEGLPIIVPFTGYILFGIGNIYFFQMAAKQVSTATAYAVWTAITIVLIKLSEVIIFKQKISWLEVFFMLMIMGGIMGLKAYGANVK